MFEFRDEQAKNFGTGNSTTIHCREEGGYRQLREINSGGASCLSMRYLHISQSGNIAG